MYTPMNRGKSKRSSSSSSHSFVLTPSRIIAIAALVVALTVLVFAILDFVWDVRTFNKLNKKTGNNQECHVDYGWVTWGHDIHNTRNNDRETKLSRETVGSLQVKWTYSPYNASVSATPTIHGDDLYYPDWSGMLWKVDRKTGAVRWSLNLTPIIIANSPGAAATTKPISRTSPAYNNGKIYIGSQMGALLIAIDASDGSVDWIKRLHNHPYAAVTQSFTVHCGKILAGVASTEEGASRINGYVCCTFQGHFGAYDVKDGTLLWRVNTLPDNGGASNLYSGGAVWGSSPSVDVKRGQVFIGIGNTYEVPAAIETCRQTYANYSSLFVRDPCIEHGVHENSLMSIDIETGVINWAYNFGPLDSWVVACGIPNAIPRNPSVCPQLPGPDADFGQAPIFIEGGPNTPHGLDVVVAGQKSGFVWCLNAATGTTLWSAAVCPGGVTGGLEFGSASDGVNFYFACSNSNSLTHTLLSGMNITYGSWGAVNIRTGSILWQTPNPGHGSAFGPVSIANGVVYGTSRDSTGVFVGLDADTGSVLYLNHLNKTLGGGASVYDGMVYVGTGYAAFSPDTGKLVALGLP